MLYTTLYCYEFSADGFVEDVELDKKNVFYWTLRMHDYKHDWIFQKRFLVSLYRRLCNSFYFNLFIGFGETTGKRDFQLNFWKSFQGARLEPLGYTATRAFFPAVKAAFIAAY